MHQQNIKQKQIMLPKSPRNYMPASTNHCFFLNSAALSFFGLLQQM